MIRPKFTLKAVEAFIARKLAEREKQAIARLHVLGLACVTMARGNDQNDPSAFPITYAPDVKNPKPLRQREIKPRDLKKNPAVTQPEFGDFLDQTGNLRNSISYFIIKNGKILDSNESSQGAATARKIATARAKDIPRGLGLVVVAGQSYALHVEAQGYDVISSAEQYAKREMPKIIKQLRRR